MAHVHQFARADGIARHARAVLGCDRAARSGAGRYHADSVGARARSPRGGERIRAGAGRPAHTPRHCPAVHPDRRAGTGRRRSAAASRRRSHEPGSHAAPAHKPDDAVCGAIGRGPGRHLGSADVAARRVHSGRNGGRGRGLRRVDRGCRWRPSRRHGAGDRRLPPPACCTWRCATGDAARYWGCCSSWCFQSSACSRVLRPADTRDRDPTRRWALAASCHRHDCSAPPARRFPSIPPNSTSVPRATPPNSIWAELPVRSADSPPLPC